MAATLTVVGELAARYAQALYELSDEAKAIDRTERDVVALLDLIGGSDEVRAMIASPLISRQSQTGAITALAGRLGLSDLVVRFVGTLASSKRLFALPQIGRVFLEDLKRRRGEMEATVVAAHPLTADQQSALVDAIKGAAGSKVTINLTVDPSLLGGLVVKVGSRLIDASVRTRLNKLKFAMKGVR